MDYEDALSNSEDTLIFLAISPQFTNMKNLTKEIKRFIQTKREKDATDRFNIIAFEELGPVYFEDFVYNEDSILDAIDQINYARPNTMGGIFVAITFIIDVFKLVSSKTFRLLVIMDKSAPEIQNPDVVLNLVSQVVDMPFFIEFVRINVNDPKSDLQLIKFAKKCNGEVYFSENDGSGLRKVLDQLAEKKKVKKSFLVKEKNEKVINPDNEPFYQNLAQDLQYMDDEKMARSVCHICQEKGELVECPKCRSESHAACLAMWAQNSNIGVPYLFRCDQCFNLLKLPKEFVDDVQSGKFMDILKRQIAFNPMDQHKILQEREKQAAPSLKTGEDLFGFMAPQDDSFGSVGGDSWDDSADDFSFENNDDNLQIQWCKFCGKILPPEANTCSGCGGRIK